jgi:hypothetical protein
MRGMSFATIPTAVIITQAPVRMKKKPTKLINEDDRGFDKSLMKSLIKGRGGEVN